MTSEAPGGPWLAPALLGVVAGLGLFLVSNDFFDGRARSLIFPQLLFLGAGLGILYSARAAGFVRGPGRIQSMVLVGGFYVAWALMYFLITTFVPAQHG